MFSGNINDEISSEDEIDIMKINDFKIDQDIYFLPLDIVHLCMLIDLFDVYDCCC